jgi:hypothetical protein
MQSVSQLLTAAAWLANAWQGLLRWRHMSSSRQRDVSLATKARAYLPSSEKSLTIAMPYVIGMTVATRCSITPRLLRAQLRAARHWTFSDGRNLDRNKGEFRWLT